MRPQNQDTREWEHYQELVLHKLDEHSESLKDIAKDVSKLKTEVGMLKVRSGFWGLLGGLIPVVILFAAKLLG